MQPQKTLWGVQDMVAELVQVHAVALVVVLVTQPALEVAKTMLAKA